MTAQAEPIGTQGEPTAEETQGRAFRSGRDKTRFGDPVWVAVIGMVGVAITAAATIIAAIVPNGDGNEKVATVQSSVLGSVEQVTTNGDDTEVTLAGTTAPGVEEVAVMIGPRGSGGQYWAANTKVYGQEWRLVVETKPQLPRPYEIEVRYKQRTVDLAASQHLLASSLENPPPTPDPAQPGQISDCVVVQGDSCFQGQPGWGSPSIYQSEQ